MNKFLGLAKLGWITLAAAGALTPAFANDARTPLIEVGVGHEVLRDKTRFLVAVDFDGFKVNGNATLYEVEVTLGALSGAVGQGIEFAEVRVSPFVFDQGYVNDSVKKFDVKFGNVAYRRDLNLGLDQRVSIQVVGVDTRLEAATQGETQFFLDIAANAIGITRSQLVAQPDETVTPTLNFMESQFGIGLQAARGETKIRWDIAHADVDLALTSVVSDVYSKFALMLGRFGEVYAQGGWRFLAETPGSTNYQYGYGYVRTGYEAKF